MAAPRILLSPPEVGSAEREALLAAFDSNWISTAGPAIGAFEEAMAALLGRPCVAVSSGTAGLHLALRLAGVEPGDTVLCQNFTFVASANPILYEGAVPSFVDSEPRTWNLCPQALLDAIRALARVGQHPKALVVVHLYGMPAEMPSIREICERHGIALIEDAAESLGSTLQGEQTGRFGRAGVFSFNGNKIITTAGGGMVAVATEADAARLRKWSTQSREAALHYEHAELGFNYRMSNLLAAVGRAQLAQLPQKVARRREIFAAYRRELGSLPGVRFQPEPEGVVSNRWLTAAYLEPSVWGECRDGLITHLAEHGIESRPLWKPMHRQPLFEGAAHYGAGLAEDLFRHGICLPSGGALTTNEQEEICALTTEFLTRRAGRIRNVGHLGQMGDSGQTSSLARRAEGLACGGGKPASC